MLRNIVNRVIHKLAFFAPGGGSLRPFLHRLRGAKIGRNVWISQFVYLDELHPENVTIGDNCTIGLRTSIFSHFYWGGMKDNYRGTVVIGDNVFIGPHCVILPNVRIGEGAVVKAGTVVSRNVPPRAFLGTPQAEVLGHVTVPLTREYSYAEFARGVRLIRPKKSLRNRAEQEEGSGGEGGGFPAKGGGKG